MPYAAIIHLYSLCNTYIIERKLLYKKAQFECDCDIAAIIERRGNKDKSQLNHCDLFRKHVIIDRAGT